VLPTFTVNRTRSDTNNIKPKQEKVRELLPKLTQEYIKYIACYLHMKRLGIAA
jgi:hypothetical protein